MIRFTTASLSVAVVLASSIAWGQNAAQEAGPHFEHVKAYGPMLGTWRYEGPLAEGLKDVAKKETKMVFEFTWRRILNKNVVMEDWSLVFEDGTEISGRAMIGWDATQEKLIYGGLSSIGYMTVGTVEFDKQAKSSTLTARGITAVGEKTSLTAVVTKTGKDSLTWQALERTGGLAEGASQVYTFKRVPRSPGKKTAK